MKSLGTQNVSSFLNQILSVGVFRTSAGCFAGYLLAHRGDEEYSFDFFPMDGEIFRNEGVGIRHSKLWDIRIFLNLLNPLANRLVGQLTSSNLFGKGSQLYSVPYHVSLLGRFSEISFAI